MKQNQQKNQQQSEGGENAQTEKNMQTGKNAQTEKNMQTKKNANAGTLAWMGLMTAVICVMGPLVVPLPFSPVPISLTNFAVYLAVWLLGAKKGTISYLIYLLIGLIGVPVFSAFTGGAAKLLGPTGGYLIGFIFMALICGFFIEKGRSSKVVCFLGMVAGTAVAYLFGTLWLAYQAGMNLQAAFAAGVLPFLPGDLVKIALVVLIGPQIRQRLEQAGVLTMQ